ncbi:MAG: DUF4214 domain-containing protein [Acidimicrobiales bacterium]
MNHRSPRRAAALALALLTAAAAVGLGATPATAEDPQPTSTAVAPTCPQAEGNARFVRFIYLQILQRCPEDAAVAYFTKRLDGGLTRFNFAETIDMSNENLGQNNVIPLYTDILGRPPTDAELVAGKAFIRANHQDGRLIAKLIASDEAYGTIEGATTAARDRAWLEQAYQGIVETSPTAHEVAKWMAVFGAASSVSERTYVANVLEALAAQRHQLDLRRLRRRAQPQGLSRRARLLGPLAERSWPLADLPPTCSAPTRPTSWPRPSPTSTPEH